MLNKQQYNELAQLDYSHIALVTEVLADLETPLSTYLKLANQPYSYLLESVQGGEVWGRYSIIGLPSHNRIEVHKGVVSIIDNDEVVEQKQSADPLADIRSYKQRYRVPPIAELPRFCGGLVGYFGYDTLAYIEPHLGKNEIPDPINAPDILLMLSTELVVFDNLSGRLYVVVHAAVKDDNGYENALARTQEIIVLLDTPLASQAPRTNNDYVADEMRSSFSQDEYQQIVEKCKQYIYQGDVFQVVPSRRVALPFNGQPLDVYRALRTLNPSPYMYYFNLQQFHIAGSSPEILTRVENGEITLRPIAGTRKRGATPEQDEMLVQELLTDEKECAEHLMLIDLGRNDVGRVAEIGSVELTDKMIVEKYSQVMHIVSNVTGKIKPELDAIDVLKATFPAGTLSGAPKIRALEIIEEVEPDKRGIYSGAIGYIGWNDNMDTAIAIRTALIKDDMLYAQAGGGVVLDSVPIKEWEETVNKLSAVLKAVEMVNKGLRGPLNNNEEE